ncbi:MAG: RNA polymerase sigma-70 factor [Tannerellaceae bacterium]|nr:RNA polymerase sigma-70 factor [Tannerellaceae bacterium]
METDLDIQRLKQGNEQIFKRIVSAHWNRMYKFASIYTMNEEVAKEIAQDSFLALWDHRNELQNDTSVITLLMVINRNKCLDYLRKRQTEIISLEDISEEHIYLQMHRTVLEDKTSDLLIAKELEEKINIAINKLPKKTRLIFIKSRHEGLMNKEIAEELAISVKTVEFHITKSLQLLRKDLSDEFPAWVILFYLLQ